MNNNASKQVDFAKFQTFGFLLGILGLVACAFAYLQDPKLVIQSYFNGYMIWLCVGLGCFGLTLLQHTVKARWGIPVLRIFEAGGGPAALLLMAILFLPIAFHLPLIYDWVHPEIVQKDPVLSHRSIYMNVPFFLARAVLYFTLMIAIASFLRKSTLKQDRNKDVNEFAKRINLSSPGIALFILIVNFAFTDWVMSLTPHWYSSIYGFLFVVYQALLALSLGTVLVTASALKAPYSDIVRPALTKDLGNMLFTLTMLWGYFTISQFLIIWSGNLPELNTFYVTRNESFWIYIGAALVIGQFFIPFFLLLSPRVKANPKYLMILSGFIFLMGIVTIYWNIIPMFRITPPNWIDFAAFIGMGGLWYSVFASRIRKASLLPSYDLRLVEDAHSYDEEAHHA